MILKRSVVFLVVYGAVLPIGLAGFVAVSGSTADGAATSHPVRVLPATPIAANLLPWTIEPTPNPNRADTSYLSGVSCEGPRACTAVGYSARGGVSGGTITTLAERWNGTSWTIEPTPNPNRADMSYLSGVSCEGPRACTAVGYSARGGVSGGTITTLAERWNGTSWTIEPTPNPNRADMSYLSGVSCEGPRACTAVGYSARGGVSGGTITTLAERWNGTSWTIEPTPNPNRADMSYLSGVSCEGPRACTAVGYSARGGVSGGTITTLAERWNGTSWTIEPTPNPNRADMSYLSGVSCEGPRACTAVGYSARGGVSGGTITTLAERWNGTSWTIEPTPNPNRADMSYLSGVSCEGPRACTAVGYSARGGVSGGTITTLAERWNGTSWTIEPTPNPNRADMSYLSGVSCEGPRACTAVGYSARGGVSGGTITTLAERSS